MNAMRSSLVSLILCLSASALADAVPSLDWGPTVRYDDRANWIDGFVDDMAFVNGQLVLVGDFKVTSGHEFWSIATYDDGNFGPAILPYTDTSDGLDSGSWVHSIQSFGDQAVVAGAIGWLGGRPVGNLLWLQGSDPFLVGDGWPRPVQSTAIFRDDLVVGSHGLGGATPEPVLGIWRGTYWTPVIAPPWVARAWVFDLLVHDDAVWVAGAFEIDRGEGLERTDTILRWDGTAWDAPGGGLPTVNDVRSVPVRGIHGAYDLEVFQGAVHVAGTIVDEASGVRGLARFENDAWVPLPTQGNFSKIVHADDVIYPLGDFVHELADGESTRQISAWDGGQWIPAAGSVEGVDHPLILAHAGAWDGTRLFVAAEVVGTSYHATKMRILKYEDGLWSADGSNHGFDGRVEAIRTEGTTTLFGGRFHRAYDLRSPWVLAREGSSHRARSNGLAAAEDFTTVNDFEFWDDAFYAVGRFLVDDGSSRHAAKWTGSKWVSASGGAGFDGDDAQLFDLFVHDDDLYAAGRFTTADGDAAHGVAVLGETGWVAVGSGIAPGSSVHRLLHWNGEMIAVGDFVASTGTISGNLLHLDGGTWRDFGPPVDLAVSHAFVHDGELFFGTTSPLEGEVPGLFRWDPVEHVRLTNSRFQLTNDHLLGSQRLLTSGGGLSLLHRDARPTFLNSGALAAIEVDQFERLFVGGEFTQWVARDPAHPEEWDVIEASGLAYARVLDVVSASTVTFAGGRENGLVHLRGSLSADLDVDVVRIEVRDASWRAMASVRPTGSHFEWSGVVDGTEFRAVAVTRDGQRIVSETIVLPGAGIMTLDAAPNPFNAATTVRMVVPDDVVVTLAVYDLRGRLVRSVDFGLHRAGEFTWTWDGRDDAGEELASGAYVIGVAAGERVVRTRVTLVK